MKLGLTGRCWRVALRAVPADVRDEVHGTLADCYGCDTPVREAVQTIGAAIRMRNRAVALAPIELWRFAARNVAVFYIVLDATMKFGRALRPNRYSFPYRYLTWELCAAALVLVLALLVRRGSLIKTSAGVVAMIAAAGVMTIGPAHVLLSFGQVEGWRWIMAALLVGSTLLMGVTSKSTRTIPALVLFSAAATTYVDHEMRSKASGFSGYGPLGTVLLGLVVAGLLMWSRSPDQATRRSPRWPIVLALCIAGLLACAQSDSFASSTERLLGRAAGAIVVSFIGSAIILLAVRPQLFLFATFGFLANAVVALPTTTAGGFANARTVGFVATSVVLIAVGHFGSKRALRV